jgi:hypothetical protein
VEYDMTERYFASGKFLLDLNSSALKSSVRYRTSPKNIEQGYRVLNIQQLHVLFYSPNE